MIPNLSSRSRQTKSSIRPGVLLIVLLLAALSVFVVFSFRGYRPPAKSEPQLVAAVLTNIFPTAPARAQQGVRPTRPAITADAATAKLMAELFDESLPLQARRKAARTLARLGSDAAMDALKSALGQDTPAYLKAAIAEGLGECPNPAAGPLLASLAGNSDEIVARGAVRGLGARGDENAVNQLGGLLFSQQTPLSVRTEAAIALGDADASGAKDLLIRAAGEIHDETLLDNILTGLGKRPFSETESFFNDYLSSPEATIESKVAALEALGDAEGEVSPFLLKYLGDDSPELRAAAAWALNTTGGECGPQLAAALGRETDASVRTSIYQALQSQSGADVETILPLVKNESDPSARLAGLAFLAGNLDEDGAPRVSEYFRQTAIPELEKTALQSVNSQNRFSAVIALKQAQTPESLSALQDIARQSSDRKVIAATQVAAPKR